MSDLDSTILFRKLPRQRLHAIHHPLEIILLLASYLSNLRRVIFLVTPLDLKRRKVELRVYAVDILVVVGGEAAECADQGDEFVDVVPKQNMSTCTWRWDRCGPGG